MACKFPSSNLMETEYALLLPMALTLKTVNFQKYNEVALISRV